MQYIERHDNIEAIYKKLQDRRDTADVTELLKELHRIVNAAIRTAAPGGASIRRSSRTTTGKRTGPRVEATFAQLVAFAAGLDAEQRRAAEEGLTDDELALFDLLFKDSISKKDRERVKQASQGLLSSLRKVLAPMPGWLGNETTQAQVKVFILDQLYETLPRPPFTESETEEIASRVYDYVWQRSASGNALAAA